MFHGTASFNIMKWVISFPLFHLTDSRIMKEGFKIGGVDGHPVAHGSAAVSHLP